VQIEGGQGTAARHDLVNTGSETMRFLCLIPNSATGRSVTVVPECGIEK
jgi:hypothetical protein